jgi:hypothetical protein
MRTPTLIAITTSILFLVLASSALAQGRPYSVPLEGSQEVGPGDPDGSGVADLTINPGLEELCFSLAVEGIESPTRAHIHEAPAGQNGPIVVFFFDIVIPDPIPVTFEDCVHVDRDLARDLIRFPEDFYVNIHNAAFPAGAIRGQLAF